MSKTCGILSIDIWLEILGDIMNQNEHFVKIRGQAHLGSRNGTSPLLICMKVN